MSSAPLLRLLLEPQPPPPPLDEGLFGGVVGNIGVEAVRGLYIYIYKYLNLKLLLKYFYQYNKGKRE